jgi:broad specificity phosphatase PhoE
MSLAPRVLRAQPSVVVLVRHGEKATEGGNDPSLSDAGRVRAQALADALAMTTPTTIIVSSLKRTAETAAVVSAKTGVVPTVIAIGGGAQHVADVAAAVRKATGVVLVVGHSNTVPAIVEALAGAPAEAMPETEYDRLSIVRIAADGSAELTVERY